MAEKNIVVVEDKKPRRSTSNHRAKLAEAKKKGREALSRARRKNKDANLRAGAVAVGANVALGLAARYQANKAGDTIAKGRKAAALSRDEQIAFAKAREESSVPHFKPLGEAGTWGGLLLVAGLATGQRDLTAAGVGLVGTQAFLAASGKLTVDKAAASSQGGTAIQAALAGQHEGAEDEGVGAVAGDYDVDDFIGADDDDDVIEGAFVEGDDGDDVPDEVLGALPDEALEALAGGASIEDVLLAP